MAASTLKGQAASILKDMCSVSSKFVHLVRSVLQFCIFSLIPFLPVSEQPNAKAHTLCQLSLLLHCTHFETVIHTNGKDAFLRHRAKLITILQLSRPLTYLLSTLVQRYTVSAVHILKYKWAASSEFGT